MEENSRRKFIKNAALLSGAALVGCKASAVAITETATPAENKDQSPIVFKQEGLPYAYDALEPFIDKMTMEIHFTKHHMAYINNLNKALAEQKVTSGTLDDILANISKYNTATRNNAGGHWNHTMFWKWMQPKTDKPINTKVADAINGAFGSMDKFKDAFTDAAMKRFGSGWAWLIVKDGKLQIVSTPNQDNPLMDVAEVKGQPVLGLDVWEHAYYLKYQNLRKDYITNWYNVVNWDQVAQAL
jgi:Fe-Mn family superoxide dismutase